MPESSAPCPQTAPHMWPWSLRPAQGAQPSPGTCHPDSYTLAGRPLRDYATAASRVIVIDEADAAGQANVWATACGEEFWEGYGMSGGFAVADGWAAGNPQAQAIAAQVGVLLMVSSLGEVELACQSGVPATDIRLVLDEANAASVCAGLAHNSARSDLTIILPADPRAALNVVRALSAQSGQNDQGDQSANARRDADVGAAAVRVVCDLRRRKRSPHDADMGPQWQALREAMAQHSTIKCVGVVLDAPCGDDDEWAAQMTEAHHDFAQREGWTVILIEDPTHADASVSATQCARQLADRVRTTCQAHDLTVPRVEYLPSPGVFAHSTLLVDTDHGQVEPMIDDVGDLPIVWAS